MRIYGILLFIKKIKLKRHYECRCQRNNFDTRILKKAQKPAKLEPHNIELHPSPRKEHRLMWTNIRASTSRSLDFAQEESAYLRGAYSRASSLLC